MTISLLVILLTLLTSVNCEKITKCEFNTMCTCKYETDSNLDDVTCVDVPMARIPDLPNERSTYFDVLSSGIEVLDNESFGSFEAEFLRLISNNIIVVGEKTFSVMTQVLKSLDLSFNEIDEIPFEALKSLRKLDWLNLQSNQIARLSGGDWGHNKHTITNIFLGENDIMDLPTNSPYDVFNEQSLVEFKLLSWVTLDSNKLSKLQAGTLPTNLQTISVNNNFITEFPAQVLDELLSLRWLYLRGNYIEELPDYTFRNKQVLDKLDLGENGIKEIFRTIFNGSLTIYDLHLDSNLLRTLPPQVFRGLNVKRLYLANNRLRYLDEKTFLGIGPYLEFVDLDGNLLNHVPKALNHLKRLKYLFIAHNNITDISDDAFRSFSNLLKALSLAGNRLTYVPWNALRDCIKLSRLNIGYNRIHTLNESDFENWGYNLNTIILGNNRISNLDAHIFRNTPKLKELSLSFNQIHHVHEDVFVDIGKSLESLEISFGIYREEFPSEILKPLFRLAWLSLDNNNFRSIPKDALYNLGQLEYLNLDSNHLESLPNELFHENIHKFLRDVKLSYNSIKEILTGTFSKLLSLKNVVLTGNEIKNIYKSAFVDLPSFVTLMLSNNNLHTIEPRAFINLPNLARLELQNNELKEFGLNIFLNVTSDFSPMVLNISRNQIKSLLLANTGSELFVRHLDVSFNHIQEIPVNFLQHIKTSLRILNLGYNSIERLDRNAFGDLDSLEVLTLEHNNIMKVERKAFHNLDLLQILSLQNNHIDQLQSDQFKNLENLRIVDLSYNHIRSLSRDIFRNTRLEKLNIANNEFVVIPSNALAEVGYTLRNLDISSNNLEHVDSTMFHETPFLVNINLSKNKITVLADNVFYGVGGLVKLDISSNPLRANFKELFHYLQKLKYLSLADVGLSTVPILPLPNLNLLNLSNNFIDNIYINSVEHLTKLRTLVLSDNKFSAIPSNIWIYMPVLKNLYISSNPIKIVTKDSFNNLHRLQHLDVSSLENLERFDSDSFIKLKILTSLKIQTWPKIEKYRFRLGSLLTSVPTLQKLTVEIMENTLTDQLIGAFNPKLKYLEVRGKNLKNIEADAFEGVEDNFEFHLKIYETSVEELKPRVFHKLENIKYLTLDLSNNKLKSLSPSSFYSNSTTWENIGTRTIYGGITANNNPWSCDCGLIWVGHWLRRWLRETVQIHTSVLGVAQLKYEMIRQAKCLDSNGRHISIVDLYPEDLSCHASALSRGGSPQITSQFSLLVLLILISCSFS